MSITRVFRVIIHPEMRETFEEQFSSLSVKTVSQFLVFLLVSMLKPTQWNPDKYAMITEWKDESVSREQWYQAVIPAGMERFVKQYWVHHYQCWNPS